VAADACRCLGLPFGSGQGSTHRYLKRVGTDEKRTVTRNDGGDQIAPLFSDSRVGALTLVSESGLYKLIMRSDKDTARPFQDWVTGAGEGD
jgi:prophage antirepressor-like protein